VLPPSWTRNQIAQKQFAPPPQPVHELQETVGNASTWGWSLQAAGRCRSPPPGWRTYFASIRTTTGIRHVLVNGTFVARDAQLVRDALPGRPVRATR
jgi:hypothetical protein